jgi:hypothetical protein
MLNIFVLFTLLFILYIILKKNNIEGFHNLIDPRYHILSVYDNKNLYQRFMDYFHYGNISKYDYSTTHPLNLYSYPMNYIKSPYVTLNKSPYVTLNKSPYVTLNNSPYQDLYNPYIFPYSDYNYLLGPQPIRTTIYEIQKINNHNDYSYQVIDKDGNLHLLDYNSDPEILNNENFNEQVWMNPHDKKIIFIPK